ncbi:MAG: hypothetical protein D3904_09515 [Candidatus Electrothrix sp. EH2]|nr:hypothetical protein [Candidatus Electrothrix sp. EH2]
MFFTGRTACRAVDSSNRIYRRFYSSLSHLLVILLILSFFTTYELYHIILPGASDQSIITVTK